MLKGISSGAFEIEAEVEIPSTSTITEFGFQVRESTDQKQSLDTKQQISKYLLTVLGQEKLISPAFFTTLHEAPLKPDNKRIKMNIFVDDSSIEIFANDGKVVFF
ncbi:hypothetical protein GCM10020331_102530 [Ectobacillus funiculus]